MTIKTIFKYTLYEPKDIKDISSIYFTEEEKTIIKNFKESNYLNYFELSDIKSTEIESSINNPLNNIGKFFKFPLILEKNIITYEEHFFNAFKEFIFQIYDGLRKGYDIIADATHLNTKSRSKLFKNIPNNLNNVEVVAIYMRTPLEICIERNEKRKGQKTYVPVENLRKMFFAIQPPTIEENDHIFDIILTINENGFVTKRETQLERK